MAPEKRNYSARGKLPAC